MITAKEARVEKAKQGIENGTPPRVRVKGARDFGSLGALEVKALSDAVSETCRIAKAANSRRKALMKPAQTRASARFIRCV